MPKNHLQKVTLNLRAGDWDFIESIFKPNGTATAQVVRTLVSAYVDKKREGLPDTESVNVTIDI